MRMFEFDTMSQFNFLLDKIPELKGVPLHRTDEYVRLFDPNVAEEADRQKLGTGWMRCWERTCLWIDFHDLAPAWASTIFQ